jgi:hypothetical protein
VRRISPPDTEVFAVGNRGVEMGVEKERRKKKQPFKDYIAIC